jgi:hypothetical protein
VTERIAFKQHLGDVLRAVFRQTGCEEQRFAEVQEGGVGEFLSLDYIWNVLVHAVKKGELSLGLSQRFYEFLELGVVWLETPPSFCNEKRFVWPLQALQKLGVSEYSFR